MSSLILAIDTATPAVTAGVVRRDGDTIDVLAERVTHRRPRARRAADAQCGRRTGRCRGRRRGTRRDRRRLRAGTVHRSARRHGHRRGVRPCARRAGARRVQPRRHRHRGWGRTSWSSPTHAGVRCTGRATATVCASRALPSTPRPTCPARMRRSRSRPGIPPPRGWCARSPTGRDPGAPGAPVSPSARRQDAGRAGGPMTVVYGKLQTV